jgi:hypothetical protein
MKHLIKTTICTILILFAATALSSCGDVTAESEPPPPPAPPNPIEILEDRIESERELRIEAEARVEEEAGSRGRWELAAIALGILGIAGFVGGTAIGSKGKRHAAQS